LQLFRLDPVLGTIVPAIGVDGLPVYGVVQTDGLSARFDGVAHLSTVVGVLLSSGTIGDVNGDGQVSCADVIIIENSFGKLPGQPGYDGRADVNGNGRIDVIDLAMVTRQLAAGTVCQAQ
jgi:hypothetical protein